jgi:5'(3')-deoxyribonucleotidase
MKIQKILLDLDGVLANFHKKVFEIFSLKDLSHEINTWDSLYVRLIFEEYGVTVSYEEARKEVWKIIGLHSFRFWSNLELLPWAQDLVRLCQTHAPTFIATSTGSPVAEDSAKGKVLWIKKHFPELGYFLTDSKTEMSAPGVLLIDDNYDWCKTFREGPGSSYCFPRPWNCTDWETRDPLQEIESLLLQRDSLIP